MLDMFDTFDTSSTDDIIVIYSDAPRLFQRRKTKLKI